MKMEPIVSSETSAIRTLTPGNYPKRNKLHLERGESLKTRLILKLYKTLALPASLYVSENWTITARDARRIIAAEMKYIRITAGLIWTHYKTNTEIANELNIYFLIWKKYKTTE